MNETLKRFMKRGFPAIIWNDDSLEMTIKTFWPYHPSSSHALDRVKMASIIIALAFTYFSATKELYFPLVDLTYEVAFINQNLPDDKEMRNFISVIIGGIAFYFVFRFLTGFLLFGRKKTRTDLKITDDEIVIDGRTYAIEDSIFETLIQKEQHEPIKHYWAWRGYTKDITPEWRKHLYNISFIINDSTVAKIFVPIYTGADAFKAESKLDFLTFYVKAMQRRKNIDNTVARDRLAETLEVLQTYEDSIVRLPNSMTMGGQ